MKVASCDDRMVCPVMFGFVSCDEETSRMGREMSTNRFVHQGGCVRIDQRMADVVPPFDARRTSARHGRLAAGRPRSRGGRTRLGQIRAALDEKWDSLLECTPDLVVVVDRDGLVSYVNHSGARLLGGREDVVGRCVYDFLVPEHRARVRESIGRVFQTGETIRQVARFCADGCGSLWSELCAGPIAQNGRIVAAGVFCADITEREKLEDRLTNSEMLLNSLVRAVPKMMEILEGLIRHETEVGKPGRRGQEVQLCREHMIQIGRLASIGKVGSGLTQRLPQFLTAIGMSIENALAKLDAASRRDEVGQELEAALRVVATLTAGVEQVRGFAATACRQPLVHAVDLRAILMGVVQLLETGARKRNTVIRFEGPDELPPVRMAKGDAEQLLFSLLENVLRFRDGSKHDCITVRSAVKDHTLELRFAGEHHGEAKGGPEVSLDRLFTAGPVVKAADPGLYVAWDIVVQVGGTIRCERTATAGVTFFVRLPIADRANSE